VEELSEADRFADNVLPRDVPLMTPEQIALRALIDRIERGE
jgi:hypothetical protein